MSAPLAANAAPASAPRIIHLPEAVIKRGGERVSFDAQRIRGALAKAGAATGEFGEEEAALLTAQAVKVLAIAARNPQGDLTDEPVSPCGICRQAIVETETRYGQKVRTLLYGKRHIYVSEGIGLLLPLTFSEF